MPVRVERIQACGSFGVQLKYTAMTSKLLSALALASLTGTAFAGPAATTDKTPVPPPAPTDSPFASAWEPISSPTLSGLAIPQTRIRPIFMYQTLADRVSTILGDLPVGGDLEVYALQIEYALSDSLSIVATKDGYVDLNPDATLSSESGWANLAAGLKWTFLRDDASGFAAALQGVVEVPTGNTDVAQGDGDGSIQPAIHLLKLAGPVQVSGTIGSKIPFDNDAESTVLYTNVHLGVEAVKNVQVFVEANWFHVLDEGDGGKRYNAHVGGAVPSVIKFEGGDLLNFGASHGGDDELVTLAAGLGWRITPNLDITAAWEFPLTDKNTSLIDDRLTVGATIRF